MEYCGIDLHAEYSQICILDEDGEVMETSRVRTSRKALERFFRRDRMRVVIMGATYHFMTLRGLM